MDVKAKYVALQRRKRAARKAAGLTWEGKLRVNYSHPELKGLHGRDYQREYARLHRSMKTKRVCDCGRPAVGVWGKEPICADCAQLEGRGHTKDWREPKGRHVRRESMGNSSGAFYEPPRTEIGHGSLALLEARLAAAIPSAFAALFFLRVGVGLYPIFEG